MTALQCPGSVETSFVSAIAPIVPKLDNTVKRRIPRHAAKLKLPRRYLEPVADDEAPALPTSQVMASARLLFPYQHTDVATCQWTFKKSSTTDRNPSGLSICMAWPALAMTTVCGKL